MSLTRGFRSQQDTFRAHRARPCGSALTVAALVLAMGVTGAAAPAFAEQVTPSTPAPTESATPTPSPEATEPPATPTETPAPTETPTPDPTPTPEPTPTPTPTPEPTPTPTPTPTPEPTPTPTPPPTGEPQPTPPPETTPSPTPVDPAAGSATAAPGLLSPGTQALFSRSSPTLLAANTSSARAFEVAQARLRVETATADLRRAQTALAGARQDREVAQAIANHLQILADNALHDAEAAMRTYFAAAKGDGTTYSSMSAVFGAGNDLLAGLGGVARIAQIHGEAKQLLEMAQKRSDTAETAQQRADAAWAAVDAVPVESLEREVANAETALGVAQMALSNAETESFDSRLASSDVSLLLESLPTDSGQLSAQGWSLPVAGRITDTFGPRPNKPLPGVNEFHRGTDIAATCGSPVFAATGGTVASAGPNGSLGNWILLEHGEGVETGYGHLSPGGILVSPGQPVTAGQLIGMVGTTGASTGCHLHFEVHLDGTAIDAVPFMAARGVTLG